MTRKQSNVIFEPRGGENEKFLAIKVKWSGITTIKPRKCFLDGQDKI